jgi:hypothetical protein
MSSLTLTSCDGTNMTVKAESIKSLSHLIDMMSEFGDDELPLPNINSQTLSKIIAFAEHYHTKPYSLGKIYGRKIETGFSDLFYAQFFENMTDEQAIDLLLASNYIDAPELMKIIATKIALNEKLKNSERLPEQLNDYINSINLDGLVVESEIFNKMPTNTNDIGFSFSKE